MIKIDGSIMEGGGQLLRMATSYSSILGEPIEVYNIRAKRKDPGLKPQHLTTLNAAAEISGAETEGAALGSREITFRPNKIRGGNYEFDIGTAGSISLLLQCINPILMYADRISRISIRGGTAVNWSPPIPFLENVVYPILKEMGASSHIEVFKHGFYPRGGGEIRQVTEPTKVLSPLKLDGPSIRTIHGISLCGALPEHVAIRQANSAEKKLRELRIKTKIKPIVAEPVSESPGSFVCLWTEGDAVFIGADSLGARGKPAETVGEEAAKRLIFEIRNSANLDQHTTDHMILPTSLAGGESVFKTSSITLHTLTAIEIAKLFTDAKFNVSGTEGQPGLIRVQGVGLER
jgi:RNA 3'-terminal phosphate cyclase (ATP)